MIASKVLVIGAGAAGIACATKLIKSCFQNVFILESETRIGGRILTIPFADNAMDLGAQWCHGEMNNVVCEVVSASGKDLLETTADIYVPNQYIRSNGEVLSANLVERVKATLADTILNGHDEEMRQYKGSLDAFITAKFNAALKCGENKDIDHKVAMEFLENFKKFESSEYSGRIDEVSASGFKKYWVCEGNYLLNWKDQGFYEFIKLLLEAEKCSKEYGILEDKIIVGMKVEQIIWNQDGGVITVKCENCKAFSAEHVVVTVSLGVLKERIRTLFDPQLPKEKRIPIENLGFGNLIKIFIEFPAPFWPEGWTGFCTLWRSEDYTSIRKTKEA